MNISNVFFYFIEQSNQAKTSEELFSCLEIYLAEFGLDRIIFSLITDHPSINLKSGHGVLRNYPDDWMHYYFEKGYECVDPVRKYLAYDQLGIFRWKDLNEKYSLSSKERLVIDEGKEANLLDGIAVSFFSAGGELSGLGLASSSGKTEIDENTLAMIHAISHQFNLVYRKLNSQKETTKIITICLTQREKEVLTWVATGKNNWEIGVILGITEHGVDFHLRNIFKKLNVKSRITAVVKGIRLNLINPV